MSSKALNRWQAAGIHLLICLAIAAGVVTLMLAVWYPRPLFEAAGGNDLLVILVAVDVALGPLITLVVFRSGKPGMKFDLAVIGTVQFAALAYGVHVVALARPAFIVFAKDRFELATAVDLEPAELAAAKFPQFRSVPWAGPQLAAAVLPQDPDEQKKLIDLSLAGMDVQNFPRYWEPYEKHAQDVLAKADTIARLRSTDAETARAVDAYLASSGTKEDEVRSLLLRTRFAWVAVLVDPKTARPVKMVLGERIN